MTHAMGETGMRQRNTRPTIARTLPGVMLAAVTMAGTLGAQAAPPETPTPVAAPATPATPARADTIATIPDRQLFQRSDLYVAGAFVVATAALLPADRHLTNTLRDEDLLANHTVKQLANAGSWLGGPGPLIIGSTMYVAGWLGRAPRVAELALHGTEAVVVGSVVAGAIKNVAGRARPYATQDTNSYDFGFGRGTQGAMYKAFPSGHATAAFSVAAAVVAETHEWWPKSTWYVAPVMYGGATMVGLSRIYNDQHWASDVVMGAAIGTFAGLKTVRFNHTHTGNRIDRLLLGTRFAPTRNGPSVSFSTTF